MSRDWEWMQYGMILIAGTLDGGVTRGMAGLGENSSLKLHLPSCAHQFQNVLMSHSDLIS